MLPAKRILAVDDDKATLRSIKAILDGDYETVLAESGRCAMDVLKNRGVDLVLLDLLMPGMDGIEVLEEIKNRYSVPVVIVTALTTTEITVKTIKMGAYEYLTKPFTSGQLRGLVEKTLNNNGDKEESFVGLGEIKKYDFSEIIGISPKIREVFEVVKQVSGNSATVLIQGETGTGKELVARAIHKNSNRASGPFVVFDCAGTNGNLIESSLFGHERGAFTGAMARRIGVFEQANGGTLFLDEIGALDYNLQDKLLRVLQEREFSRTGGNETIKVDVRVIAASNKDLEEAVENNEFRKDLYHRINVVPINLPPLKERDEDISYLICHFKEKIKSDNGEKSKIFSEEAVKAMCRYNWPGNVRELKNTVERLLVTTKDKTIRAYHVKNILRINRIGLERNIKQPNFEDARSEWERMFIEKALVKAKGNKNEAARLLGTTYRVVKYTMDRLGIRYRDLFTGENETEARYKEKHRKLKRIVE